MTLVRQWNSSAGVICRPGLSSVAIIINKGTFLSPLSIDTLPLDIFNKLINKIDKLDI